MASKKNRSWNWRRHYRYVKGMRRIKEDQAEHGQPFFGSGVRGFRCECFEPEVDRGKGRTFALFADHPAFFSWDGCRNPRRDRGASEKVRLTAQELRAPRIDDWD